MLIWHVRCKILPQFQDITFNLVILVVNKLMFSVYYGVLSDLAFSMHAISLACISHILFCVTFTELHSRCVEHTSVASRWNNCDCVLPASVGSLLLHQWWRQAPDLLWTPCGKCFILSFTHGETNHTIFQRFNFCENYIVVVQIMLSSYLYHCMKIHNNL